MSRISTSFMSEVLKRPVSIELVVPADHMVMPNGELPQKNRPYRTLYYLEGMCGDHRGPLDHTDLQLLAEDYNLAIVSIGGENKWYSASPFTDDDFISLVAVDIVNFTRRVFNLSDKREDTFLGGFSMGGHGAFVIGLRHPELFSRLVSLDASLQKYGIETSTDSTDHWDLTRKHQYLNMFGISDPSEWAGSEHDYEFLAKRLAETNKELMPRIYMSCGRQDGLYGLNTAYRDMLRGLGYDVEWFEFDGAHSYYSMCQGIAEAVKWLPLEDEFAGNDPYYGPTANLGFDNFNGWRVFCNMEAEAK